MSSSIQETVSAALQTNGLGSYMSHARPVVSALEAREQEIADALINFATQQGLGEEDATVALRQVGMSIREPAPTGTIASADAANQAASGNDADLAATLSRINDTLEDLAGFARQNGWRPTR